VYIRGELFMNKKSILHLFDVCFGT